MFSDGYFDQNEEFFDACTGCGWNGFENDEQFIDPTETGDLEIGNGTNFTIFTPEEDEFLVLSFYLFCSDVFLDNVSDEEVIITGYLNGEEQYSFSRSDNFADVVTLSPNNGYTRIDLATDDPEGDHSNTPVNSIEIVATGNIDYLSFDAFEWSPASSLATKDQFEDEQVRVYPNPSTDYIKLNSLTGTKQIQIIDALGEVVRDLQISNDQQIDITGLAKGVYSIKFESGALKKFVKI